MNIEQAKNKYTQQAHRMQTGVTVMMGRDRNVASPKDLRVGLSSAMSDQRGLAKLLIDKGIITEEEYINAVADAMEKEADMHEKTVQESLGGHVRLG